MLFKYGLVKENCGRGALFSCKKFPQFGLRGERTRGQYLNVMMKMISVPQFFVVWLFDWQGFWACVTGIGDGF